MEQTKSSITKKLLIKNIKVNGELKDVYAMSLGNYVTVKYDGQEMTLTQMITNIKNEISQIPNITNEQIESWDSVSDMLTAEIKATPDSGDYIYLIDMADNGKVKKTPFPSVSELTFATAEEVNSILQ